MAVVFDTLVLETSSCRPSWGAWRNGELQISGEEVSGEVKVSQWLVPSLRSANLHWPVCRDILVGVGPGSFSAIRVAIATALGIAASCGATVHPIRSTHALGIDFPDVSFLGVLSDARRNCFFFTAYEMGRMTRPTTVFPREELETVLSKCTRAVSPDHLTGVPETAYPRASALWKAEKSGLRETQLPLEPVYLHPPV